MSEHPVFPQHPEEGFLDTSQQSVLSLDCDYSTLPAASPHPHFFQSECTPHALPARRQQEAVPLCYSSLPVGRLCGVFDFNMGKTQLYLMISFALPVFLPSTSSSPPKGGAKDCPVEPNTLSVLVCRSQRRRPLWVKYWILCLGRASSVV